MSLRWSDQQFEEWRLRKGAHADCAKADPMPAVVPAKPKRRGANKMETAYRQRLEALRTQGDVLAYFFERLTLKLADDCRYTPDFFVVTPSGMELHEVKGPKAWEDSIIKLKVAADAWPWFTFRIARCIKGEWQVREVRPA